MPTTKPNVYAGIDTHANTHHVAVIDELGRHLDDHEFPTTTQGLTAIYAFLISFGTLIRVGIEGTASYGASITALLRSHDITVREVIRPNRQARRNGKSDPIDAYAAAKTVAADDTLPIPKLLDGPIDTIRVLLKTRRSAVKARTTAIRQIRSFLVTAPYRIREAYEHESARQLITGILKATPRHDDVFLSTLQLLARRHENLATEEADIEATLTPMITMIAPALIAMKGAKTVTAAQLLITLGENSERIHSKAAFAALCGVSPIPASSGKTNRMRLNRGGDRQANRALHTIALNRMSNDERTRSYVTKRVGEGKTKREIIRCLKRYIANEVYRHVTRPQEVPAVEDLRPLRQAKKITLQTIAEELGVWPMKVSTIERGKSRDDDFASKYRDFLLNVA